MPLPPWLQFMDSSSNPPTPSPDSYMDQQQGMPDLRAMHPQAMQMGPPPGMGQDPSDLGMGGAQMPPMGGDPNDMMANDPQAPTPEQQFGFDDMAKKLAEMKREEQKRQVLGSLGEGIPQGAGPPQMPPMPQMGPGGPPGGAGGPPPPQMAQAQQGPQFGAPGAGGAPPQQPGGIQQLLAMLAQQGQT